MLLSKKLKKSYIQIIGGQLKGLKLLVLQHPELRPTTNRMRETLFNWLSHIIKGTRCLDCFAGTGILGLEAISRGAIHTTFLEKNKNITKILFNNTKNFSVKIININTLAWLKKTNKNKLFNIVFIDPPFNKYYNFINIIIQLLEKNNYLSHESYIYIETSYNNTKPITPPINWYLYRNCIYGSVKSYLYIRCN